MLIPIRCKSCNKPIASRYEKYLELRNKYRKNNDQAGEVLITSTMPAEDVRKLTTTANKTPECRAMDQLGFKRYCCRVELMTSIDLPTIAHPHLSKK